MSNYEKPCPEGADPAAWQIVCGVIKRRIKTTHNDNNDVHHALQAAGIDWQKAYLGPHTFLGDVATDINLRTISDSELERARQRHYRDYEKKCDKRRERIHAGRTRGAGAGGFNRDIARIETGISIVHSIVKRIEREQKRRAGESQAEEQYGNK